MAQKIRVSIDLNKITKSKVVNHSNGAKYYNFEVIEKKTPGKYGDTHMVVESLVKEEWSLPKDQQPPTNYIGSGKAIDFGAPKSEPKPKQTTVMDDEDEDEFPF